MRRRLFDDGSWVPAYRASHAGDVALKEGCTVADELELKDNFKVMFHSVSFIGKCWLGFSFRRFQM